MKLQNDPRSCEGLETRVVQKTIILVQIIYKQIEVELRYSDPFIE